MCPVPYLWHISFARIYLQSILCHSAHSFRGWTYPGWPLRWPNMAIAAATIVSSGYGAARFSCGSSSPRACPLRQRQRASKDQISGLSYREICVFLQGSRTIVLLVHDASTISTILWSVNIDKKACRDAAFSRLFYRSFGVFKHG